MIPSPNLRRALNPMWWFAFSVAGAAALGSRSPSSQPLIFNLVVPLVGLFATAAALRVTDRRRILFLVLAGVALGGCRGLGHATSRHQLDALVRTDPPAVIRVQATPLDGWTRSRWGHTTAARVASAQHGDEPIDLPSRCRLEVRSSPIRSLPRPGETFNALASVRGDPDRILLVVASNRLLETTRDPHGLPWLRQTLVRSLLESAGTDASRIRAAELAGALALGRKDLLPRHRLEGWRRSGLGHALAVSGLHVGIIAGVGWLAAIACGLNPVAARLFLLAAIPGYVLLAGASPSATRAGIMISVFLMARLIGRAILALGAVLLTATLMILFNPGLVFEPGFQLTVGVTAALIRWSPRVTQALRGPGWLTAAIAVPVVAQVAATPIVAIHFRTITPLAAIVNLGVPLLLAPSIPCAVAAVLASSLWAPAAAPILNLLGVMTDVLWHLGALGRSWMVFAPAYPPVVPVLFAVLGAFALRLDRFGKAAACLWIVVMAFMPLATFANRHQSNQVDLLAVDDGLSAVVSTKTQTVLFDGGRYRTQAAELLADAGIRTLDVAFVSHGDEDHTGGLVQILRSTRVETLALPRWLGREASIVNVLRAARSKGTHIVPVAIGSTLRARESRLDVLWPPSDTGRSWTDNDRSLVVRVVWPAGRVLLTGDIGASIEKHISTTAAVECDVLVVPHHGSRSSSTEAFLSATNPRIALIPAGSRNRHHHPHPEALRRLAMRHITIRAPIIHGQAGARREADGWGAWP